MPSARSPFPSRRAASARCCRSGTSAARPVRPARRGDGAGRVEGGEVGDWRELAQEMEGWSASPPTRATSASSPRRANTTTSPCRWRCWFGRRRGCLRQPSRRRGRRCRDTARPRPARGVSRARLQHRPGAIVLVQQLAQASMPCLADRRFFGHALWQAARPPAPSCSGRVKHNLRLPSAEVLAGLQISPQQAPCQRLRGHHRVRRSLPLRHLGNVLAARRLSAAEICCFKAP
jgi:hypothetical protein